jgi:hypothetical protein
MGARYKIGYGKPPKQCQFKKGQSGYPQGRPKGSKSLKAMLEQVLLESVQVTVGDKVAKMPSIKALIMSLTNKALKGDTKSFECLLKLIDKFQPLGTTSSPHQEAGGKASGFAWTELHESLRPYLEHLGHGTKPITES